MEVFSIVITSHTLNNFLKNTGLFRNQSVGVITNRNKLSTNVKENNFSIAFNGHLEFCTAGSGYGQT
jgi:hypothetical protein